MAKPKPQILVAGHICLDLIPQFGSTSSPPRPGELLKVGPAIRATGGTVANTGLALHRLGIPVRLMGKVGDDSFGREILDIVRQQGAHLADDMIISPLDATSYTVVISPAGADRSFLHCPGANDTLKSRDIPASAFAGVKLMHFGYPPLMRRMYLDGGAELYSLFSRAKKAGLTTSLDMAEPDATSEAGRQDWTRLLKKLLPKVDIFVPSVQELLFMVDRPRWTKLAAKGGIDIARDVDLPLLRDLSARLLSWDAAVVMIKVGDQGAYLRTTDNVQRMRRFGAAMPADVSGWIGRELTLPCYKAKFVGATGSGDCTIAGFLAGLIKGQSPEMCLRSAVAVGAASVESADATSGVPTWDVIQRRISRGWKSLASAVAKN